MQTHQTPEVGKTYISQTDPRIKIHVSEVSVIEADEADGIEAGFYVEGCDPKDKGKPDADGMSMMQDDWHELNFRLI